MVNVEGVAIGQWEGAAETLLGVLDDTLEFGELALGLPVREAYKSGAGRGEVVDKEDVVESRVLT